jgi:DNA polymerase I-like protein with 3'-5' exonuclease and polymerase domains
MSEYFEHVKSQKDDSGSFFVRLPRSARIRSRCSYTAACNSYFQGLAADAAKEALFRVSKACHIDPRSDLWGSHIVAFIHDEIIIEAPIDRVDEAARALSEVMEEAFALWVPEVPSKVETVAMLRWSKDADRVVEDGRLVPWNG